MRVVTFASGSTGNCTLVSEGNANILVDAGISMRTAKCSLAQLGLAPHDLCGVLITHEHSDHISGLPALASRCGLNVYAPAPLCERLVLIKPELSDRLIALSETDMTDFNGVSVRCFRTEHDAAYSVGYRFEGASAAAIATDTGSVNDELLRGLEGADIALIEANHDVRMLNQGRYPYFLKQRILSPTGHLSNEDCGKLAQHLAICGTKHIILGHLSRDNNTPELAYSTVRAAVSDMSVEIVVAPARGMLAVGDAERSECLI